MMTQFVQSFHDTRIYKNKNIKSPLNSLSVGDEFKALLNRIFRKRNKMQVVLEGELGENIADEGEGGDE